MHARGVACSGCPGERHESEGFYDYGTPEVKSGSPTYAMYGSFIFFHAISTYFTKSPEKLGVHVPLATLGSSTQSASNTGRGATQLGTGELFDNETIRSISMTFEACPRRKKMAVAGTPRPGTALQFSWHENRRRVFRWRWPNGITGCIHRLP